MKLALKTELKAIADSHGGLVKAENVVAFARDNPESALHGEFEWDNDAAAEKYRLQQARSIVRLYVEFEPSVDKVTRALVSIPSDRSAGNGYRRTSDALSHAVYRMQLQEEALQRVVRMREAFTFLPEMTPFFDSLDKLAAEYRKSLNEKAATG